MSQFFEHLNVTSYADGFSFMQKKKKKKKKTNMHPSASQKTILITLPVKGTVLDFFFGDVMSVLCHYAFGLKWWNQLSSPVMMMNRKSSLLAA
jgi:hypothetical protein